MYPKHSVCSPRRPPVGAQDVEGRSSVASRRTWSTDASHAVRRRSGSGAIPRATRSRVTASLSKSSAVYGHNWSSAALRARVTLCGSVAQPQRPLHGVIQMVGHLFHRFSGDRGDARIGGFAERAPCLELERREEQLTHDGHGEVTVLLLDEQAVDEITLVAEERVVVLAAAGAVELVRSARTARAPGREGRARCWSARHPPRAPAHATTTAQAGGRAPGSRLQAAVRRPRQGRRPRRSQLPHLLRDVIEGGMPVRLVSGGLEEGIPLLGRRCCDRC